MLSSEHEDAEHSTAFESCEVDELESYEFSLDEEMDPKAMMSVMLLY